MKINKIKSVKKRNQKNKTNRIKESIVDVLTEFQINKINSIENKRDKAIILFLLNTGLRVSEFINLNYSNIFEDIRNKNIKDEIKVIGKGNKERTIPINTTARQCILTIDNYNRTNLNIKGININTPFLISRQMTRLSRQQVFNIVKESINSHPHILRHTCFTNLKNNSIDGTIIQKLSGHSNYNTTVKYYLSVSKKDLHNSVNTLETQSILSINCSCFIL